MIDVVKGKKVKTPAGRVAEILATAPAGKVHLRYVDRDYTERQKAAQEDEVCLPTKLLKHA
jgi:hypothetical protein